MAPPRRLPKEVVARARAAVRPPAEEKRPVEKRAPTKADAKVRAKLVAHLKRLHPMD